MAQTGLDSTSFMLTNATLLPCDNFNSQPFQAELINTVMIKSASPFGVSLEPSLQTLTAYMCVGPFGATTPGYDCKNPQPVELGTFTPAEKTQVNHGDNKIVQTGTVAVRNVSTLETGFIFALLLGQPLGKKARLTLTSKDVTIKVLGMFTVHKLDLKKDVTCRMLGNTSLSADPSSKYCKNPGHDVTGLSMVCEAGIHPVNGTSEEVSTSASPSSPAMAELVAQTLVV